MKIKTKTETLTTLTLNQRETELLAGLADFPMHSAQREEIEEFLTELYQGLPGDTDAYTAGYRDATNL